MKLDHLIWPCDGWGYMQPNESVFNIFRHIKNTIDPKTWLEIGFHVGHSTTYTLELTDAKVSAVGMKTPLTWDTGYENFDRSEIGDKMKSIYGDRFEYFLADPPNLKKLFKGKLFDLAFVDGDHNYEPCIYDISACMYLKIPYILIDNCEKPCVAMAAEEKLDLYNYETFLYDSHWNGHEKLEARLYHVQYDDLQEQV